MLNSITDSKAVNYMENSLILTPVAGVIHTAVGIIKALGSVFAADRNKEFSASLHQISRGLRNMVPYFGFMKNLEEKISKANKDAKNAAEGLVNARVKAAEEKTLEGVKPDNSDIAFRVALAAMTAIEGPTRSAATEAIKDIRVTIGEKEASKAIEAAVEAARLIAAGIVRNNALEETLNRKLVAAVRTMTKQAAKEVYQQNIDIILQNLPGTKERASSAAATAAAVASNAANPKRVDQAPLDKGSDSDDEDSCLTQQSINIVDKPH